MPTERALDYNDKTDEASPAKPASRSAPNLEPNEARGGVTHHNVRVVLAASIAGAVVILAIVYFAFFG